MPEQIQTEIQDEETFAEISHIPARIQLVTKAGRSRSRMAAILIVSVMMVLVVVFLARSSGGIDPNAPRVELQVDGMHCPVQCGLRVSVALETLPWVVPESVTANPKTGIVTFAVKDIHAVNESEIEHAISRSGFQLKSSKVLSPR